MSLIFRPASSSLLRSLIRTSSASSTASSCRDFAPRTTLYQTGRSFFETRRFSSAPSLSTELSDARSRLSSLSVPLDPLTQLSLYALYKQATEGPVSTERPGADPKEVAKWDAWYNLKGLSQEEARDDYLSLVQQLCNQSQQSNGATGKKLLRFC